MKNNIDIENVFEKPAYFREAILNQKNLIQNNKSDYLGKSMICVFFTSYCGVGCPFCFFKSPYPTKDSDIKNKFNGEGLEKFINFANKANLGYLQISGGGEPFLEKEAILRCVEEVNTERIILVTSGMWAYDKSKAEEYLSEIEESIKKRKTKTRVSIRVSISSSHSIKLKHHPLVNLLQIFEDKYKDNKDFTLQLKIFNGDNTLEDYLKQFFKNYRLEKFGKNKSDDNFMIKVMPWRLKLTLESGYSVIIGCSRVFDPSLRPDLLDRKSIKKTIDVYNKDLKQSQNYNPSIIYNSKGGHGLDWIVEYNGNVCTWQNRVQDNLLNIYEDDYDKVFDETISDLMTLSLIEKGSKYREKIISEVSPKTVTLMKAVSIRDYAGTLLFEDEKIRLYYNLRVLQDYVNENRINKSVLSKLPIAIQDALKLDIKNLKKLYKKSSYSILDQELKKMQDISKFRDFLELVKLGHYEISKINVKKAIDHYNKINHINKINNFDDIECEQGQNAEKRFTERFMFIKDFKKNKKDTVINNKYIYLFRHAETNWNVEKIIKGQIEDGHAVFTAKGVQEIRNLEMFFKENNIERIFSSDLERALDTAILANKEPTIPMSFHKELRGFNMGKYQG
ncbi:MAG: hypothetical protein A2312_02785, partial [Candidatus Staskawiczbacteria bacterium RIFOXYB2_FULL_32_9]